MWAAMEMMNIGVIQRRRMWRVTLANTSAWVDGLLQMMQMMHASRRTNSSMRLLFSEQ
jgi:hypothetical protein